MEENSKLRWLIVGTVWCSILAAGVFGYRWLFEPVVEEAQRQAEEEREQEILQSTSSETHYKHTVNIRLDAFSGYCLLRSRAFRDECAKKGIRIVLEDDQADCAGRMKSLESDTAQFAVFTVDALVKTTAELGSMPGTILFLLDETRGADAIVGACKTFPNIDALNDPEVRIVATPNSPSEFMARVLMHHYNLPLLKDPFDFVDGAAEVYNHYKSSTLQTKQVYAVWEPYVSKMVANPDYAAIITSEAFRGYVVDVFVVSRSYLVKHEDVVQDVVKAYLIAAFSHRSDMLSLIARDAKELNEPLTTEQCEQLSKGIWFKNTTENFEHLGFTSGNGLQHIEEIITNVTDVLVATKAIQQDPTKGSPGLLYYDKLMRGLFDSSWHPGFGTETIRKERVLAKLSEEEWQKLRPVGTLNVPRLVFARGTAKLSTASEATLSSLVEKLKTWPQYYLVVRGNCAHSDDPEVEKANTVLAKQRAEAAMKWLVQHGIDSNRIRAESGQPNGSFTVAFVLGQVPF